MYRKESVEKTVMVAAARWKWEAMEEELEEEEEGK